MSDLPLLQATALTAVRDRRVLFRDLAVQIAAGEAWRVEGANGAGKTTLLRILCGLDQDYEGHIEFPRANATAEPWRADVLFLGHLPGLKPTLTAEENLDWLCRLRERPPRLNARDALMHVGLRGYEDVPVSTLSAGQRRRVALARLYIEQATLWVLDEPFTAIDRQGVGELETLLSAHVSTGGAVLVTTHHALAMPVRALTLGQSA